MFLTSQSCQKSKFGEKEEDWQKNFCLQMELCDYLRQEGDVWNKGHHIALKGEIRWVML